MRFTALVAPSRSSAGVVRFSCSTVGTKSVSCTRHHTRPPRPSMLTRTFRCCGSAPTPSTVSAKGTTASVCTRRIMVVMAAVGSAPASLTNQ